ncbi:MAG: glycosyltransferase family 4 protein [Clostridia bacterium]
MKILMIAGASRSVIWFREELIKYLQDKDISIEIVACDNENREKIESLGVKFYSIGSNNRDKGIFSNIAYVIRLSKLIKQIKPDKIMTFQAKPNTFGIIAAKKAGYKDITAMVEGLGSVFNDNSLKNRIIKIITTILYKIAFKKIPTVIFLNKDNKKRFLDCRIAKENQCFLINGIGVDINKFKQKNQPNIDIIKFVMIARIEKDKGIVEYCEAAKSIINSGVSNVEFNYYGICDEEHNIIEDYKDYVKYRGYTDKVLDIYENNHIVVLPSYHEGCPRSLMESCSIGRAIIASNIAGCKAMVKNGKNGLLVNVKDVNDLIEKVKFFIENKSQINIMGQASRKIAEEIFDSNIINAQIFERIMQ